MEEKPSKLYDVQRGSGREPQGQVLVTMLRVRGLPHAVATLVAPWMTPLDVFTLLT